MVSLARPTRTPERRQTWMAALLRRWVEPHCLVTAWLRTGPSWTSSERTFEQSVSPSPAATAATKPCTHRKSQSVGHPRLRKGKRASLEGSFISAQLERNLVHPRTDEQASLQGARKLLAIAIGDRSNRALHHSQVVANSTIHPERKKSEQARKDHHMHAEGIKKGKECATPSGQTSVWAHQMRTAIGPPSIPG